MFADVLKEWGASEVTAMDVYSDMFHLGEGLIQKSGSESQNGKSNPLGYWKSSGAQKGHYRILFDDTFEETAQAIAKGILETLE